MIVRKNQTVRFRKRPLQMRDRSGHLQVATLTAL
jgi:hypothetical protein